RVLEPVLPLAPRLRRDLLRGFVRTLKDARDLLSDPLERSAHGRLRRSRRLQLGDQLTGLLDIGVDRQPIVSAERYGKVGMHGRDRVVRQGLKWSSDLLEDRVLSCG